MSPFFDFIYEKMMGKGRGLKWEGNCGRDDVDRSETLDVNLAVDLGMFVWAAVITSLVVQGRAALTEIPGQVGRFPP